MNKLKIKEREKQLVELTKLFCEQCLDDEYIRLSEKLIRKLGRKRNVPFQSGKMEIWAAGIIHALGSINFLFDKSGDPHVTVGVINEYFGTKQSTVTGKSKQIRDLLKMTHFDNEFSLEKVIRESPFENMVMVDGFIVPLDTIPSDMQKMVKDARNEGRDVEIRTL